MKSKLREKAKTLPDLPGVYFMRDTLQNIIYVGKSRHLKTRVSSYFGNLKHERTKVKRMVNAICDFEYIVTDTELDALILECRLIKRHQPIYNTLLKNDKKYRFIKVEHKNGLARLEVAYEKDEEAVCFGPYDLPYLLQRAVDTLNSYCKLPTCTKILPKEDCLAYLLNKCNASCENVSVLNDTLERVYAFLKGNDSSILDFYKAQMTEASATLDFEKAIYYREQLNSLKMLGYRRKAIELSQKQSRGIALLKCPTHGFKLYILKGTTIQFTKLIKTPSRQILKNILMNMYQIYLRDSFEERHVLEKLEIDEALIMYFYLHTNTACCYYNLEKYDFVKIYDKIIDFYFLN